MPGSYSMGEMKSVPPRGSGWVSLTHHLPEPPTRYRVVVLTSFHRATRQLQY